MTPSEDDPPPDPVLPPGRNVGLWDLEFAGCLLAYAMIAVVILGLPVALIYGLLSGDWRLLIPWAIIVVIVFILGRLNKIPIIE